MEEQALLRSSTSCSAWRRTRRSCQKGFQAEWSHRNLDPAWQHHRGSPPRRIPRSGWRRGLDAGRPFSRRELGWCSRSSLAVWQKHRQCRRIARHERPRPVRSRRGRATMTARPPLHCDFKSAAGAVYAMLRKPRLRGERPRTTRWLQERWDSLPIHEREYRKSFELVHDVASSRCSSRRSPSVADWSGPAARPESMPTAAPTPAQVLVKKQWCA